MVKLNDIIFDPPIWDRHHEGWCMKCRQDSCDDDLMAPDTDERYNTYIAMACTICGQRYWYTIEGDDDEGSPTLAASVDDQFSRLCATEKDSPFIMVVGTREGGVERRFL